MLLSIIQIIQKNTNYTKISFDGLQFSGNPGAPQLPVKYVRLLIPKTSSVSNITVSNVSRQTYEIDHSLYPVQQPRTTGFNYDDSSFTFPDSLIYHSSVYPAEIVKVVGDSYFDGGNHIVTITIYPVQYHPLDKEIDLITSITFTLQLGSSTTIPAVQPGARAPEIQKIYDNALKVMVDNPEDIPALQSKPAMLTKTQVLQNKSLTSTIPFYNYVIITTNPLKNSFNKFIEWKRKKGLDIGVVTIEDILANYTAGDLTSGINDAAGNLRQYLKDAYTRPNGTVYALLADSLNPNFSHNLPIRFGCGGNNSYYFHEPDGNKIPTDLYFSSLSGNWNVDNDNFYGEEDQDSVSYDPNIYVGSMFFKNSQEINDWTNKVIIYEANPFNGSYDKVTKNLWTESDEMQEEQQPSEVINSDSTLKYFYNYIVRERSNLGNSDEISDARAGSSYLISPTGKNIIDTVNLGFGFWNIYHHGEFDDILVRRGGTSSYNNQPPYFGVFRYDNEPNGQDEAEVGNGLDNINSNAISTIVYSIACRVAQPDVNNYRSFADVYTTLKNSGPAFLGNTRNGLVYFSYPLHIQFIDALFNLNNNHLGIVESISKYNYQTTDRFAKHYLSLTHSLYGDPEMSVWTATPSQFNNVTITDGGNYITVNSNVTGSNICVSSLDNGQSYYMYLDSTSSYTFSTSVRPLYITITKQNYIPFCGVSGGTLSDNFSLSGRVTLTNNITVGAGDTLTLVPGTTLLNPNGDTLFVHGTLLAKGTSADSIIINNPAGYNSGAIIFSDSSSYGSSLESITLNNGVGIRCLNRANVSIKNSVINNCYRGIYIYNSAPQIRNNQIMYPYDDGIYVDASTNNPLIYGNIIKKSGVTAVGVYSTNYSNPQISQNQISGFDFALYIGGGSTATLTGMPNPNNLITGNTKGLTGAWGGTIYGGFQGIGNNNSIHNNTYDAYAYSYGNIYAEGDYWGRSSNKYCDGTSVLDCSSPLTSDPWNLLYKVNGSTTNNDNPQSITDNSKVNGIQNIIDAFNYEENGNINNAVNLYVTMIQNDSHSEYAISQLFKLMRKYSRSDISSYFANFSADSKYYPLISKLIADNNLQSGQFEAAMSTYDNLIKNYPNGYMGINAKFQKLFANVNIKKDVNKAKDILNDIKAMNLNDQNWISQIRMAENLLGIPSAELQKKELKDNNSANSTDIVKEYALFDNYPNPFNPSTTIKYQIPQDGFVTLKVYDILGKEVKTLVNEYKAQGRYSINFNASNLASGIYIYQLKSDNFVATKKMLLIK